MDILKVQEIRGWNSVTDIPNTPDYIKGVINLRGIIVPIIDLRERFSLESLAYGPTTVVIVIKVQCDEGNRTIGIVVDAVSDVYSVSEEQTKPPPNFGSTVSTDYIKGLASVDEKMLILLDIDHLINTGVLSALDDQ